MEKEVLKKLRKNLPKESRQFLADKFGLTVGTIAQILLGNRNNENVISEAVKIAYEHRKNSILRKQIIDQL